MDLPKYIIRLLEDSHQVTIPSLGRFELVFESVKLDLKTQKIFPPNYQVIFFQQHDLNDTSIIHKIAHLKSEKEEDICSKIGIIISNWKIRLKTDGFLKLDKFGFFTFDKEKIHFQISDDCIFNFKNFGLPVISNLN